MITGSINVQDAIERGMKVIALPAKAILIATPFLFVLLLFVEASWWDLAVIPLGLVASTMYSITATNRWRTWAYENVKDIHQFQRSAELSGLLPRLASINAGNSVDERRQTIPLEFEKRFSEEHLFIDDQSIPGETIVYSKASFSNKAVQFIVLNEAGIRFGPGEFCEWNQIKNDRIAHVSYLRDYGRGYDAPAGSRDFLRLESCGQQIEIPLSILNISAWKLDLLFYIYRGRHDLKNVYNKI